MTQLSHLFYLTSLKKSGGNDQVMASVALCHTMEASCEELLALCIDKLGKYKAPKEISILAE